jgi:hypothetical protein
MQVRAMAVIWVVALTLLPARAFAQAQGAVAGIVRDATGAVLPGVTVEAASPALIEKLRTRPPTGPVNTRSPTCHPARYEVTFSLPGFNTSSAMGVEVASELHRRRSTPRCAFGAVAETITVTGAARSSTCSRRHRPGR